MKSTVFSSAVSLFILCGSIAGCGGYSSTPGPKGDKGEVGPQGEPGNPAERVVHRATFVGPEDLDDGILVRRNLTFTKADENTAIRLTYYDHLTVNYGAGLVGCRWTLLLNGQACSDPGLISGDIASTVTTINATTISGWCSGTAAGALGAQEIEVKVRVGPVPAGTGVTAGDCLTGMAGVAGFIEAEELY